MFTGNRGCAVDDREQVVRQINQRLHRERHRRGRGLERAKDRFTRSAEIATLPDGTVIVDEFRTPLLILRGNLLSFSLDGWIRSPDQVSTDVAPVLTPPTSLLALANGFRPHIELAADGVGR